MIVDLFMIFQLAQLCLRAGRIKSEFSIAPPILSGEGLKVDAGQEVRVTRHRIKAEFK